MFWVQKQLSLQQLTNAPGKTYHPTYIQYRYPNLVWNRLELDPHIFTQGRSWAELVPFGGLVDFGLGGPILGVTKIKINPPQSTIYQPNNIMIYMFYPFCPRNVKRSVRLVATITTMVQLARIRPHFLVHHVLTLQPYLVTKCEVSLYVFIT